MTSLYLDFLFEDYKLEREKVVDSMIKSGLKPLDDDRIFSNSHIIGYIIDMVHGNTSHICRVNTGEFESCSSCGCYVFNPVGKDRSVKGETD